MKQERENRRMRRPSGDRKGTSYFNDMLGTTVGTKSGKKYSAAALTAFGEGTDADKAFFTGKPMVEGLGHTFLFRNYRASIAKWQTADPMGYPDGWNQLAYCNNGVTSAVDLWGSEIVILHEVRWNNFHLATVWADCNHDYYNPSFVIGQGMLIEDSANQIDGSPNYIYDTVLSIGDITYSINVSFECEPVIMYDRSSDSFNLIVRWSYQIKFTITESWYEDGTLQNPDDPTNTIPAKIIKTRIYVERDDDSHGEHYIPE